MNVSFEIEFQNLSFAGEEGNNPRMQRERCAGNTSTNCSSMVQGDC